MSSTRPTGELVIYRPCPVCLDGGTRQVWIIGQGVSFHPCELCKYRKALTEIADPYNAKYHAAAAARVAREALESP